MFAIIRHWCLVFIALFEIGKVKKIILLTLPIYGMAFEKFIVQKSILIKLRFKTRVAKPLPGDQKMHARLLKVPCQLF